MRSAIHEAYTCAVLFTTAFFSNGNQRSGVAQLLKVFFAGKERERVFHR